MQNTLQINLEAYIKEPRNPGNNFSLAKSYEAVGETAAAISFYVRAAELSHNKDLAYSSLIRIASCLNKQGNREVTMRGVLLKAASIGIIKEECLLLSQSYERTGDWQEAYTWACNGILDEPINYELNNALLFQKAVSAWWIGQTNESRKILHKLKKRNLNDHYKTLVQNNLSRIGGGGFVFYDKSKHNQLRHKFTGSENIERNYSQTYQDMFVLSMLNGKRDGVFLEIGCADPFYGNNTALLEEFGWNGISIDNQPSEIAKWQGKRKAMALVKDATTINYSEFLAGLGNENYDYLQIDCEPPSNTYKILLSIPFEKYKFSVITFEHDFYCDTTETYRELSRKYLQSHGYELVVNDISPNNVSTYEDWWVHPDMVNPLTLLEMKNITNEINQVEDYMLPKTKKPLLDYVNVISLPEQEARRVTTRQRLQVINYEAVFHDAFDGRIFDYTKENDKIKVCRYFNNFESGGIATVLSHLTMIKDWYSLTVEKIGIFAEDDMVIINLRDIEKINQKLPNDWLIVQLSLIKENIDSSDMLLKTRQFDNWSAGAYMITREYAEMLINEFWNIKEMRWDICIKSDSNIIPFVENVLYLLAGKNAYTYPICWEDTTFDSTFYPTFIANPHKAHQVKSAKFLSEYWNNRNLIIE